MDTESVGAFGSLACLFGAEFSINHSVLFFSSHFFQRKHSSCHFYPEFFFGFVLWQHLGAVLHKHRHVMRWSLLLCYCCCCGNVVILPHFVMDLFCLVCFFMSLGDHREVGEEEEAKGDAGDA